MNTNDNAVQKVETERTVGDAAREGATRLISSVAEGVASLTVGILGAVVEEYNRQQALEKQAKKDKCVALVQEALRTGERVSRQQLYDIIPALQYCNTRVEIALYIGVTIEEFDAGVKRWYHLF